MTLGIAWVGRSGDGIEHLYMATDSRTRGAMVMDSCPKILTLPRSDCAICYAGNAIATYPLMIQLANAISAHLPARDRSLDILTLKPHLLHVFTDIIANITDAAQEFDTSDAQFMFGGYSWLKKSFKLWTIYYSKTNQKFSARPANNFHSMMQKVAFIGDRAKEARSLLQRNLDRYNGMKAAHLEFEPFKVLRDCLRSAGPDDTIGGPPQLIKIGAHMNTKVLAIKWRDKNGEYTSLLGRKVFHYENIDTRTLDPDTFEIYPPRSFGYRPEKSV